MYINHHNMLKSFASDYINIYIYGKSSFPQSQPQLLCNIICAEYNHTYIFENATACKARADQYRKSAQATHHMTGCFDFTFCTFF